MNLLKPKNPFQKGIFSDAKKYLPLLLSYGLYYFFTGLSSSVIYKETTAVLSPRLISLQNIISWAGGILLGLAWSKWNTKLIPLMTPLFILQMAASVAYFIYSEITLNMFIFWVLSLVMYVFFIGLADKIFECARAWFFKKSEERASYDNLIDMVSCVTGFSGYIVSIFYVPSLRAAVLFSFLATFSWCAGILVYNFTHKIEIK